MGRRPVFRKIRASKGDQGRSGRSGTAPELGTVPGTNCTTSLPDRLLGRIEPSDGRSNPSSGAVPDPRGGCNAVVWPRAEPTAPGAMLRLYFEAVPPFLSVPEGDILHIIACMGDFRLVTACFDESGKLHDSKIVVFGGCAGAVGEFDRLAEAWSQRLAVDGVTSISMKDAMNFKKEFSEPQWKNNEDRRDALLFDLATLVFNSPLLRICSPQITSEFKSLCDQDRQSLGGNPQYQAFEACVTGLLGEDETIAVNVVCDLSEEYAEKCLKLFHKLRSRSPIARERLIGISFVDDTRHPGLQAADMIVYCRREYELRSIRPSRPIVEKIVGLFGLQDPRLSHLEYELPGDGLGSGRLDR